MRRSERNPYTLEEFQIEHNDLRIMNAKELFEFILEEEEKISNDISDRQQRSDFHLLIREQVLRDRGDNQTAWQFRKIQTIRIILHVHLFML